MTTLTQEEYFFAQIILNLLYLDSDATIEDVVKLTGDKDINLDAVVNWIQENNYAMLAYDKWGGQCILSHSYCPLTDKGTKYLMPPPIDFGNGRNDPLQRQSFLKTAEMSHITPKQIWKRQK